MKKSILFFLFFVICSQTSAQVITKFEKVSQLIWSGKAALSEYKLSGTLQFESVEIEIDNQELKKAYIVVNMKSLDAEIDDLEKHLKQKDFFDVKRYPKAVFELDNTILLGSGIQRTKGYLSIKDERHPMSFDVEVSSEDVYTVIKGEFKIDRTKYGITYLSPSYFENLKDKAIADDIYLSFVLKFIIDK